MKEITFQKLMKNKLHEKTELNKNGVRIQMSILILPF